MTDKEIIIDGVDVSGCCQYMPRYMEDYDIDTLDYCRNYFKPCKDVDVKYCYFKQLQRKAQECEQLKDELATYGATGICETCTEKSILQNDKYIKALREIKEIAEKAKKDICNNCGWKNTDSCDAEDYTCGEFIKILQKISEVKE